MLGPIRAHYAVQLSGYFTALRGSPYAALTVIFTSALAVLAEHPGELLSLAKSLCQLSVEAL